MVNRINEEGLSRLSVLYDQLEQESNFGEDKTERRISNLTKEILKKSDDGQKKLVFKISRDRFADYSIEEIVSRINALLNHPDVGKCAIFSKEKLLVQYAPIIYT